MKLTYAILVGLLLSFSTLAAEQSLRERIINNHYAYVPGEGRRFPALIAMPVLMLLGATDDIAEPLVCEALVDKAPIKRNLIVEKYPGAWHGFDVVDAPPIMDIGDGMTIGYQQEAAEASWQAILRFLVPRD